MPNASLRFGSLRFVPVDRPGQQVCASAGVLKPHTETNNISPKYRIAVSPRCKSRKTGRQHDGFYANYEYAMGGKWLEVLHETAPRLIGLPCCRP
jgi:hypothetical protein